MLPDPVADTSIVTREAVVLALLHVRASSVTSTSSDRAGRDVHVDGLPSLTMAPRPSGGDAVALAAIIHHMAAEAKHLLLKAGKSRMPSGEKRLVVGHADTVA